MNRRRALIAASVDTARLPSAYKEVEYIEVNNSSGACAYLSLPITKLQLNYVITIKIKQKETTSQEAGFIGDGYNKEV